VKSLPKQLLAAALLLGSVAAAGAWQGPTQAPPGGNAAAPLNVGAAAQSKQGTLGVGGLGVFGRGFLSASAGYALPANLTLGVNGAVGASQYCDAQGLNCVTTVGGAAAGGASAGATGGGDQVVCGGWDTKYGAGLVAGSAWGCASPAGAPACPAGYDTVSSSHATINLAEHTNLCVLSRAGSAGKVCRSGFADVGSFCIQSASKPAKDFYEAGVACATDDAQLCSWSEWSTACQTGALTDVKFGAAGAYEWIDDYGADAYVTIADPIVYGNCKYLSRAAPSDDNRFRCCY
jgi:hypothetical protein